jgi:hypothetical protein
VLVDLSPLGVLPIITGMITKESARMNTHNLDVLAATLALGTVGLLIAASVMASAVFVYLAVASGAASLAAEATVTRRERSQQGPDEE